MYAITFDLDIDTLRETYPHKDSYTNACADIRKVLADFGFEWQHGSVYFGNSGVDAVICVLATQELTTNFHWFASSVRDIRMLRIEENTDLAPALAARDSRTTPQRAKALLNRIGTVGNLRDDDRLDAE